jgi:hypothetical protein
VVHLNRVEIAYHRMLPKFLINHRSGLRSGAIVFAGFTRDHLGTGEPPHAEKQRDDGRDDAQTWSGEGRRAEIRHWNGVVDRRRSRHR